MHVASVGGEEDWRVLGGQVVDEEVVKELGGWERREGQDSG